MTNFIASNFINDGMYMHYVVEGERKFVARSKRSGANSELNGIAKFLIKNFTVEEYFDRLAKNEAPLVILQSKGYLLPHIKKWLKQGGYTVDMAGYDKYMQDRLAGKLK